MLKTLHKKGTIEQKLSPSAKGREWENIYDMQTIIRAVYL